MDGLDNNCNDLIDDDDNQVVDKYNGLDHDEDGDGDAGTLFKCTQPKCVDSSDDCNDLNDTISLNKPEFVMEGQWP